MKKITLKIDGMSCGMCEAHINEVIRAHFKVRKLKSNYKTGESIFLTDEPIDQVQVESVVNPTGYRLREIHVEPYEKERIFSFLNHKH